MLELPNVSLVCIDTRESDKAYQVLNKCCENIKFGEVVFVANQSYPNYKVYLIDEIKSCEQYSKFCFKELCKYVEKEYVLIVQCDGWILNSNAWVEEFLQYDYIGAPWLDGIYTNVIGNGGFSLRSKRLMNYCSTLELLNYHPEDLVICYSERERFIQNGFSFAPVELARKFSVENAKYTNQFGFHGVKTMAINNIKL